MKTRRLKRIVKHILEEPLRLDMIELIRSRDKDLLNKLGKNGWYPEYTASLPISHVRRWPSCNTVACLSGWENLLYGKPGDGVVPSKERLELPNYKLFMIHNWPYRWQREISGLKSGTREYALIVAQVVDDYIKTGGWINVY